MISDMALQAQDAARRKRIYYFSLALCAFFNGLCALCLSFLAVIGGTMTWGEVGPRALPMIFFSLISAGIYGWSSLFSLQEARRAAKGAPVQPSIGGYLSIALATIAVCVVMWPKARSIAG